MKVKVERKVVWDYLLAQQGRSEVFELPVLQRFLAPRSRQQRLESERLV
jgi:hypothetical protein